VELRHLLRGDQELEDADIDRGQTARVDADGGMLMKRGQELLPHPVGVAETELAAKVDPVNLTCHQPHLHLGMGAIPATATTAFQDYAQPYRAHVKKHVEAWSVKQLILFMISPRHHNCDTVSVAVKL